MIETERDAGVANLTELADRGSALAMMYLGHLFVSGQHGCATDFAEAERWWKQSAEGGSIEGAYRLANFYLFQNRVEEAIPILLDLSGRGYAPATNGLGSIYYLGTYLQKDLNEARGYFSKAAAQGHLVARQWCAVLLMKHGDGIADWLRGLTLRLGMTREYVSYRVNTPRGDRVREWIN